MIKKIGLIFMAVILGLTFTGCETKEKNLEGNLEDIMAKIYEQSGEEQPMMLANTELTNENLEYYLGVKELDFKEGIASESQVGSIAHSIVLVRVNEGVDIEKAKEDIKANVNPNKWICVGVEDKDVIVDSKGDMIILIMVNETASKYHETFKNLS